MLSCVAIDVHALIYSRGRFRSFFCRRHLSVRPLVRLVVRPRRRRRRHRPSSVRLVVRPPVSVLPSRRPFRCRRRSSFVKPSRQTVCLCSAVVNIHHRFGALRAPNITYSGAVPPRPRRMCPSRDLYGTNFGPLDKSRGTYSRDGFLLV